MPRRRSGWFACLGLGALLAACSGDGTDVAADDPGAYPNRRPSYGAAGHMLAYVANTLSDTVTVIDLDAMAVLGTAPVGRDPVDIDGPTGLVVDRARGLVYLALSYPTISGGGPHQMRNAALRWGYVQALALDDLRTLGEVRVDQSPAQAILSSDGTELVVSHDDLDLAALPTSDVDSRRAVVDLIASPFILADGNANLTSVTACIAPFGVAFGADAARVFVACTGEDALATLDVEQQAIVAAQPAADPGMTGKPYALVADGQGQRLLLGNKVARTAVAFTTDQTPQRLFTAALDGVPYFAAWTDDDVLVPMQSPGGLVRLDRQSGEIRQQVSYPDADCSYPRDVQSARGALFVLCEGDHLTNGSVVRLDPQSLQITATVTVGLSPDRLVVVAP